MTIAISFQPKLKINWDNFRHIQHGMSESQVIKLLGVPPGDYATGPALIEYSGYEKREAEIERIWHDDEGRAVIRFDENDCLSYSRFLTVVPYEISWFQRLRWRIEKSLK